LTRDLITDGRDARKHVFTFKLYLPLVHRNIPWAAESLDSTPIILYLPVRRFLSPRIASNRWFFWNWEVPSRILPLAYNSWKRELWLLAVTGCAGFDVWLLLQPLSSAWCC